MARVHPKGVDLGEPGAVACIQGEEAWPEEAGTQASVLTVWRRSLLFNGNGFAVFDAKGNLAFRVDNYASGSKKEVVLMDGAGKPLLTIRRKKLSLGLGEQWMIYEGEDDADPRFVVKRHVNPLHSRALQARVIPCVSGAKSRCAYKIEGSYSQRRCAVLDGERRPMAEIKRKEPVKGVSFGLDVFHLVVQPGFDASVAMTIVMLLEQMFGSRSPFLKIAKAFA
ncbi:protein LURP-one-related 8-like [Curcuma longa]|uniref:protein LURP-one-related 8-like n=1 Tax=Curcuma longa TaxID=136217 RepID=UPI003D9EE57A